MKIIQTVRIYLVNSQKTLSKLSYPNPVPHKYRHTCRPTVFYEMHASLGQALCVIWVGVVFLGPTTPSETPNQPKTHRETGLGKVACTNKLDDITA